MGLLDSQSSVKVCGLGALRFGVSCLFSKGFMVMSHSVVA